MRLNLFQKHKENYEESSKNFRVSTFRPDQDNNAMLATSNLILEHKQRRASSGIIVNLIQVQKLKFFQ
jgi:hypothetical protein